MKKLLLPVLLSTVLVLVNVARADSFDSDYATVKKGKTTSTAKIYNDKKTYVVPITFADGADWSSVKDYYDLSEASEACLRSGHAKLSVGSDGTLTWSKK